MISHRAARWAMAVFFIAVVVVPLIVPYLFVFSNPAAFQVWGEFGRIGSLLTTTILLVVLTLLMSVPIGVSAAIALDSTSSRWRSLAIVLLAIALVTPLPVTTVAWHAVRLGQWSPFMQGLLPAAALHALAGIPWIVFVVYAGLRSHDPAIHDDAALHAGPMSRLMKVTLPGIRGFIAFAALWVAMQTATEIVITDMAQVRTFAEEVYTQAIAPGTETNESAELAVARGVAATMPMPLLASAIAFGVGYRWKQKRELSLRHERACRSNRWATVVSLWVAIAIVGIPIFSIVARSGATMGGFSMHAAASTISSAIRDNVRLLATSVLVALIVGFAISAIAGMTIQSVSVHHRLWLIAPAVISVTVPAPVIGLGVRATIDLLLNAEERVGVNWLRGPLYDGPSLIPVAWAWTIRSMALAFAIWFPAMSRLPADFGEATRLETDSWMARLRHDIWPALRRPFLIVTGVVTLFCFSEVSASRLVATPGGQTFAHDIFARMHFGVTPDLAAMCVVLMLVVVVGLAAICYFVSDSKISFQ